MNFYGGGQQVKKITIILNAWMKRYIFFREMENLEGVLKIWKIDSFTFTCSSENNFSFANFLVINGNRIGFPSY